MNDVRRPQWTHVVTKNKSGIYLITNSVNGNRYVGSATNFECRFRLHRHRLRKMKHKNPHLQSAWYKYGEEQFVFQPIIYCDKSMLICFEQRAMDILAPEYNIAPVAGSTLGYKLTEAHKRKIGDANRGRKLGPRSPETCAKISASLMGRKSKPFTAEHIANMSAAQKGRTFSEEHRANLSAALKGKGRPWSKARRATYEARYGGGV